LEIKKSSWSWILCKKKLETTITNNLKYSLIASSTSINDGLLVPHLLVANWLSIVIGLLITIKLIRESLTLSSVTLTPLLNDILSFIDKWISSSNLIKIPKTQWSREGPKIGGGGKGGVYEFFREMV
jgi:hypothetical protein